MSLQNPLTPSITDAVLNIDLQNVLFTNQPTSQTTPLPFVGSLFKGNIVNSNGEKLKDVTIRITGQNVPPNSTSTTNDNGDWSLLIPSSIDPTQVNISFVKEGFVPKYINNPQQTSFLSNITSSSNS